MKKIMNLVPVTKLPYRVNEVREKLLFIDMSLDDAAGKQAREELSRFLHRVVIPRFDHLFEHMIVTALPELSLTNNSGRRNDGFPYGFHIKWKPKSGRSVHFSRCRPNACGSAVAELPDGTHLEAIARRLQADELQPALCASGLLASDLTRSNHFVSICSDGTKLYVIAHTCSVSLKDGGGGFMPTYPESGLFDWLQTDDTSEFFLDEQATAFEANYHLMELASCASREKFLETAFPGCRLIYNSCHQGISRNEVFLGCEAKSEIKLQMGSPDGIPSRLVHGVKPIASIIEGTDTRFDLTYTIYPHGVGRSFNEGAEQNQRYYRGFECIERTDAIFEYEFLQQLHTVAGIDRVRPLC